MIGMWLILSFALWLLTREVISESVTPILIRADIDRLIKWKAEVYGHEPDLISAFVFTESSYRPDVVGAIGEIGLMQISPIVLKEFNEVTNRGFTEWHLHIAEHNLEIGCWYLRRLQDHYGLKLSQAVRAYNCGLRDFNRGVCYRYGDKIDRALQRIRRASALDKFLVK